MAACSGDHGHGLSVLQSALESLCQQRVVKMHEGFVQSLKIQANNSLDNLLLLKFMVYVKFVFCVVQLLAQWFLHLPVFCGVNMCLGLLVEI